MSGFLVSAQRILTLKSNNYSGELTLEFECSGGPDIRTITVEKNKTYTLTYTYIAKKTPDQVIKQPDTQIMIGTDPITGLPKYTTVPGQSYTIYATPVSIPLKVSIVGGASNDATASFAGTLSKGSLKVE